ncbi:hypothetical protein [Pseudoduganella sp. UC29_71]|uniref:hypothetical protein n=1 Tax=Pseudoduganella sp. UC29_71 TaxID=3350174 RepID=UPI00366E9515
MDYETVGKLIFGLNRLQCELSQFRAAGAPAEGAAWDALLADVAAAENVLDTIQRRPAELDIDQVKAALERCVRASDTLKGMQC